MSKRSPLTFDISKATPVSKPAKAEVALQKTPTRKHANDQTPARSKSDKTKVGREGRQFIAAHVLPEAAKQFKLMAVQQERSAQDLLIEAMNDLFAKYGLSRIADS